MADHPDVAGIRRMLSLTMEERLAMLDRSEDVKLGEALSMLSRHRVELVVIGGAACVLQGVPIETADLDIVPRRSSANIERLWQALAALDGGYRDALGHV